MTVKSLLVKIGADTKELKAGLARANKSIQDNKEKFRKAGRAMTIAGAAVVGAVGLMVKSYVKAGDEVHKMALRTGFSTEMLSELKYAAEISGANIEALEKGIKRMAKTINDATKAGGAMATYVRAFDQIGLKAEELIELSPEKQFEEIARAIAGVENPTIRAARAQDIFGRAGTQLLPLFAAGEEGLDALRQKARDLGIVFDQEAANKAAVLNDSLTTLKGSFKGVGISLANMLVPAITSGVQKISDIITKIKDWTKEHPKLAGTIMKIVVGLGGLMAILGPLAMVLPALVSGVSMLGGAFTVLLGPVGLVTAAIAAGLAIWLKYKAAMDAEREATEKAAGVEERHIELLKEAALQAGLTTGDLSRLLAKYKDSTTALIMAINKEEEGIELKKAWIEVHKKDTEELEKETEAQVNYNTELDNYIKRMERILGLKEKDIEVTKIYRDVQAEVAAEVEAFMDTYQVEQEEYHMGLLKSVQNLGLVGRAEREVQQIALNSAEQRAAAMATLYGAAKGLLGKLAAKSKLASLALAIINTAEAVTVALKSAPPPFNIALAAISAAAGAMEIATISSTSVPTYGKGGIAWKPQLAMVGEEGPELITPLRKSQPERDSLEYLRLQRPINLNVPIYIAGEKVEEKVIQIVNKSSELGDLKILTKNIV